MNTQEKNQSMERDPEITVRDIETPHNNADRVKKNMNLMCREMEV